MLLMQSSAFFYSLGWALINSFWQMALLWLTYLFLSSFFKNLSAAAKNLLASILFAGGFLWFIISIFFKLFESNNSSPINILSNNKLPATSSALNSITNYLIQIIYQIDLYLPYLSIVYLFILFALIMKLIRSLKQSLYFKSNGISEVNEDWNRIFNRLVEKTGLSNISLRFSHILNVPATVGFLKPVIFIPVACLNNLTQEQAEAILLHEMAHIRRHDYLFNLFFSVFETVLFFNPFAKLLSNTIKKERENACDDFVLLYSQKPAEYASALFLLEQKRSSSLLLAQSAIGEKSFLLLRIKRILNVPTDEKKSLKKSLYFILLIFFSGVLFLTFHKRGNNEKKYSKIAFENIIKENKTILPTQEINIHFTSFELNEENISKAQVKYSNKINNTHTIQKNESIKVITDRSDWYNELKQQSLLNVLTQLKPNLMTAIQKSNWVEDDSNKYLYDSLLKTIKKIDYANALITYSRLKQLYNKDQYYNVSLTMTDVQDNTEEKQLIISTDNPSDSTTNYTVNVSDSSIVVISMPLPQKDSLNHNENRKKPVNFAKKKTKIIYSF